MQPHHICPPRNLDTAPSLSHSPHSSCAWVISLATLPDVWARRLRPATTEWTDSFTCLAHIDVGAPIGDSAGSCKEGSFVKALLELSAEDQVYINFYAGLGGVKSGDASFSKKGEGCPAIYNLECYVKRR